MSASPTLLKRVQLSHIDLLAALRFAQRLLNEGDSSGAPRLTFTEREALELALIVSYARPFKHSDNEREARATLPARFLRQLTPEQLELHRLLLSLRDHEVAHSDPGPAQLKIWVGEHPPAGRTAMHATSYRGGLSDEGVRAAASLIKEMLHRCDQERRRIAPLLPSGQTF
jgi:hypothetical protein